MFMCMFVSVCITIDDMPVNQDDVRMYVYNSLYKSNKLGRRSSYNRTWFSGPDKQVLILTHGRLTAAGRRKEG
jgi:hypothetical protein